MLRAVRLAVLALSVCPAAFAATQGAPIPPPLPLFPPTNWWNVDVSAAPLDPSSAATISAIPGTTRVHPDWGGNVGVDNCSTYGFPYIVVDSSTQKVTVDFTPGWPSESDGVGVPFYPIPSEATNQCGWIEQGMAGSVDDRANDDRHILMIDPAANQLWELFNVWYNGTNWEAASGAFWDMNTNAQRTAGYTSSDAAGLQILPGLVRYDEVYGPNEINHAVRFTLLRANGRVFPAMHDGGSAGGFPYGMRFRLKASKDITGLSPEVQKICRALKQYGMIFADQGSNMYISGSYDTRWNMDIFNNTTTGMAALTANDFEVIQLGWNPSPSLAISGPAIVGSGDNTALTVTAYAATFDSTTTHHMNYSVATGYAGTVHFTSSDGSAALPPDYTFVPGDSGSHTFITTFHTAGGQTIGATDVSNATVTGTHLVIVGPPTPAGLVATANGTSSVSLSWSSVSGATQYEIYKLNSTNPYASLTTTASTSASDSAVTAGNTYVYKVRAIDSSLRVSPFSTPDAATTISFSNDPIVAGTTTVNAAHINELRQAVNAMRATARLAPATFTDPSLAAGFTVKTMHIQELRTSLDQARSALGLAALIYTDPALTVGVTTIKAAHVQELRNGVK